MTNIDKSVANARLLGPFCLRSIDGQDLTPNGAKASALLAILLMAPRWERSRQYLIEKLWSDRQPIQASNSLRSAFVEIRKALHPYQSILETKGSLVSLAKNSIARDLDDTNTENSKEQFLEGSTVRDPQFLKWLDEMRSDNNGMSVRPLRPTIVMKHLNSKPSMHVNIVNSGISLGLADWCAMQISVAGDDVPNLDMNEEQDVSKFVLETSVAIGTKAVAMNLDLTNQQTGRKLWSQIETLSADPIEVIDDITTHKLVNRSIDNTIFKLTNEPTLSREAQYLERGAIGAIRLIFRNLDNDLEKAKNQLAWNQDIHPSGIYLAWSAYILAFYKGDRNYPAEALIDEAEELASKALELDPYNSMTLALCSYVFTYLVGKPEIGLALAEKSIGINRMNPLAWSFRSAAFNALGDCESAFLSADRARSIAGDGPYRYAVETYYCIAATLTNRIDEAIGAGEYAMLLNPGFKPSMRYLTLLYASKNDERGLERMIRKIRLSEPDFSVRKLVDDANYPSEILRQSTIAKSFSI